MMISAAASVVGGRAAAEGPQLVGAIRDFKVIENGGTAPEVPFLGFDGNMHRLSEMRGRVLLVNFWATWCGPCFAELPEFDRLQARMGGQEFAVVLVNQERIEPERADAFLDFVGMNELGTYFDPRGDLFRAFGGRVLPVTFLLGRDGMVLGKLQGGADWAQREARELIRFFIER